MSNWIGKAEASARLGISVRTVLDLAARRKLKTQKVRGSSGQMETQFEAGDVERYGFEKEHPTVVDLAPDQRKMIEDTRIASMEMIRQANADSARNYVIPSNLQPAGKWLTLKEAAEYSGLPSAFLGQLIDAGKLRVLDLGKGEGKFNKKGKYFKFRVSERDLEAIQGEVKKP